MPTYLLSVYWTESNTAPSPEQMEEIDKNLEAFNEELKAAGAWVFAGGLHDSSTATVVRVHNGEVVMTDGPFAESKEHLGGLCIITAPDLDAALAWAEKATRACTVPVEVRPFHGPDL